MTYEQESLFRELLSFLESERAERDIFRNLQDIHERRMEKYAKTTKNCTIVAVFMSVVSIMIALGTIVFNVFTTFYIC